MALTCSLLSATGATGFLSQLERVTLFGHEYVRLSDWAQQYRLQWDWGRKEKEITVSGNGAKLQFTVDSREAQINGVTVYLSIPVARRGATPYISTLDLRTTVHPLLFPPKSARGGKVRTICLDPGHGGRDPGNLEGTFQEKKLTLLLAEDLKKELERTGFKVFLTRTNDVYMELADRPALAKRKRADVFVSLHYNSSSDSSVAGCETYCMTPAYASSTNARGEGADTGACPGNKNDARNLILAWHVQRQLTQKLQSPDRGVRRARFAVLKNATLPAILIEGAFMSNATDCKKATDSAERKKLAQAIAAGLAAYKKAVEG